VRRLLVVLVLLCGGLQVSPALAQGFAAVVSPPRFELKAKPGALVRSVIEISNRATTPGHYRTHTADFTFTNDYGVAFQEALQPGSCRPWVALERPEFTLAGAATMHYRFEVQIPPGTPATECRFAILLEGADPSMAQAGSARLPIVGRIAVIVYIAVGDGAPKLEIFGPDVVSINGERLPALRVHNSGTAHGRMGGFLTGIDARGVRYDFQPSEFPILPGEVREVFLSPSTRSDPHPTLNFPVRVKGTLEWADQKTPIDERFE
jgi:hypothetical protein